MPTTTVIMRRCASHQRMRRKKRENKLHYPHSAFFVPSSASPHAGRPRPTPEASLLLPHRATQLPNGLRVITVEQPHLHSASVSLFVKCGSRHESAEHWGLTHLVEHMLFRGCDEFPTGQALAREFERAGGHLNAATWRDHTSLSTPCHPRHIEAVLSALGNMVQHPRLEGLAIERRIIEEEILGDLDEDGQDTDPHNISRAAIWRGHPMGRRITGSCESIGAFSREDILQHQRAHYVGANAVLCIAGRVDASAVENMAHAYFGAMPSGRTAEDGATAVFAPDERLTAKYHPGAQVAVQLTFEGLAMGDADFGGLVVLTRILDDGIGSRLQQAVCERAGLVYELSTGLDCYNDCGLYDIELKAAPEGAAKAIDASLRTLASLCDRGVSTEELELARERSLQDIEFSIDSCDDIVEQYGTSALLSYPETLDSEAERLRGVTPEEVARVAQRIFTGGKLHGTLVGPLQRVPLDQIHAQLEDFDKR